MEYKNIQLLLNKRPKGMPDDDCWRINNETITSIGKNEILIKVKYLSIDPYMRGRMNEGVSYAAPAKKLNHMKLAIKSVLIKVGKHTLKQKIQT